MSADVSEMGLTNASELSDADQSEQAAVAAGGASLATELDTPLRFSLIEFLSRSDCRSKTSGTDHGPRHPL
ncbi:MAG: hypothetical protein F6K30_17680 [Cyanothece sp. SIO2G6]|nr:hypothetical protein [Cyanothece sp. SIO2G6]